MQRRCGECSLCCKLLPVRALDQPHSGCAVYGAEVMPRACRLWSYRWLVGDTGALRRPDRANDVIDLWPDFVTLQDTDDRSTGMPVVVIWVGSRHQHANRDPALRDFLPRHPVEGVTGLVRFNSQDSIVLFAPPMSADG